MHRTVHRSGQALPWAISASWDLRVLRGLCRSIRYSSLSSYFSPISHGSSGCAQGADRAGVGASSWRVWGRCNSGNITGALRSGRSGRGVREKKAAFLLWAQQGAALCSAALGAGSQSGLVPVMPMPEVYCMWRGEVKGGSHDFVYAFCGIQSGRMKVNSPWSGVIMRAATSRWEGASI